MFERSGRKEVTFEASREIAKPKTMLKPRKVSALTYNIDTTFVTRVKNPHTKAVPTTPNFIECEIWSYYFLGFNWW